MTKIFNVVYILNGKEKKVSFDYIPERISTDEIKLNNFLRKEIAKQEHVEEEEISIVEATCTLKFG